MLRCAALVVLLGTSTAAPAQWAVADARDAAAPPGKAFAQVRNEQGYRLQVYRDGDNAVRVRFVLRDGFDLVGGCPTFQVDGKQPEHASADGSTCIAGTRWAEFVVGRIAGNRVASLVLHRLLNGETIRFRYPLKDHGYGETAFTLSRSKQAVTQAIGKDVRIAAE